ncbi:hypothetical protein APHAL10511_003504 [Amanita phalloides]|nr:hypothetical protein APHAL10511_003504 [Amanita phalloides]
MVSLAPSSWVKKDLNNSDSRPSARHDVAIPKILDLSAGSITRNVHAVNSNCPDDRMKFVMTSLVNHLHDFVRETSITTEEWMSAIEFLTDVGKTCTDLRQEFVLLSDVLGVSTLVDAVNNVKPPGATEATVLGPFYTEDAHEIERGASIASEGKGDYLFVEGQVLDLHRNPIPGAIINTWETDSFGLYDNQYDVRSGPECRGRLRSADDGSYAFRAVVPTAYPVPDGGPVRTLVEKLGRHPYRPAHLHMSIEAPGYETLVTALYWKNDPYIMTDAVFGVRTSLVVDPQIIHDPQLTLSRGFKDAKSHSYLKYDFVLATPEECRRERMLSSPGKGGAPPL